ncbi:hypothetical protein MTR67_023422 [Solanum verrucosum]|uniref:Integrase catalytic domain-containing protein n=1 Tax=Solanum verrucosum TaxID=315347 RepID=A0AAF0TRD1_SOLVR|nr:hypothetical protein MTR67_023422 [Solanum verrucosum]
MKGGVDKKDMGGGQGYLGKAMGRCGVVRSKKERTQMRSLSIIFDRGTQFTPQFWRSSQKGLGTHVKLSTNLHPQTDGKAESTIKTLEDMLRDCVIDFKGNWDDHLPLIEFAYNNSYQSSIGITPFEVLYGRRCRSPIGWFEVCEVALIGPELVHEAMEEV